MGISAAWHYLRQKSHASIGRSVAATVACFVVFGATYFFVNFGLLWAIGSVQDLLGVERSHGWYYYSPVVLTALVAPALCVPAAKIATSAIFKNWDRMFIIVTLALFSLGVLVFYLLARPFTVGGLAVNLAAVIGIWIALPQFSAKR